LKCQAENKSKTQTRRKSPTPFAGKCEKHVSADSSDYVFAREMPWGKVISGLFPTGHLHLKNRPDLIGCSWTSPVRNRRFLSVSEPAPQATCQKSGRDMDYLDRFVSYFVVY
jgi:hypothetical protein